MSIQGTLDFDVALRDGEGEIWQQLLGHQFLVEVEENRLPEEKLLFYFVQNVNYINSTTAAAARAAAVAPTADSRDLCIKMIDFEYDLIERQRGYVQQLSGSRKVDWEIAPICHAYTSYLLRVAAYNGTLAYLVAMAPCAWTYGEFAPVIGPSVTHPVAADWLSSFSGDDIDSLERQYEDVLNDLGRELSPNQRTSLQELFHTGCRYEHMFWDMSYNMARWPI
jgi:thiaminase/transcriptional activator TenA